MNFPTAHATPITLVPYQPSFNADLQELFYHTIYTVNARDYIKEQLQAWAPAHEDPAIWKERLHGSYALLAFSPEQHLLGFGNVVCPAPDSDLALFRAFNPPLDTKEHKDTATTATTATATTTNPIASGDSTNETLSLDNIALLDYLYVSAAHQGQHIGTQLCMALELYLKQNHCSMVLTHASLTAQSFFAQRGYTILKHQQVERRDQVLANALMGKRL